jgi:hypothetical protein
MGVLLGHDDVVRGTPNGHCERACQAPHRDDADGDVGEERYALHIAEKSLDEDDNRAFRQTERDKKLDPACKVGLDKAHRVSTDFLLRRVQSRTN